MRVLKYIVLSAILLQGCHPSQKIDEKTLYLDYDPGGSTIGVTCSGELLTLFQFSDSLYKPLFFPVNTIDGIPVTRGYPFDPRPYESMDHPHQSGLWFNYGDINGIDFWNNSLAISQNQKQHYGHIATDSVFIDENRGNGCGFTAYNTWIDGSGVAMMTEKAIYRFEIRDHFWTLTRCCVLYPLKEIHFNDNKEGLFAIRLAHEFRSDFHTPQVTLNGNLQPGTEEEGEDMGKNGRYVASNGKEGDAVWGTSAKWVSVSAVVDGDSICVAIFDHPQNFGFPAFWHARNYGLFAVNNLARQAYNKALPPQSLDLNKGDSISFIHRILIKSSGFLDFQTTDSLYQQFSTFKFPL